MNEMILHEFYNKVLNEIANGEISIDGWNYNIKFKTIINGSISDELKNLGVQKVYNSYAEETLIINNIEEFNEKLIIYTSKMLDLILNSNLRNIDNVGFNGSNLYIIDFVISNLWSNATDQDLINPVEFISNRINFLDDNISKDSNNIMFIENMDLFNGSSIEYDIELNNPVLETPYSFCPRIVKNKEFGEIYELPKVFYGISNGVCYIYAVQGKNHDKIEENSYQKKMNRTLYKVNKGVEDDYDFENIKDVTPSSLLSLTLFLKFLTENNIREIRVIDYLPIRYNAKLIYFGKLIKRLENQTSDEIEIKSYKERLEEKHIKLQTNITNKFIRNFTRLSYQLGVLNIKSYPREIDSMMHLSLTDNLNKSDNILNQIYNLDTVNYNSKKI